jgi:glycosyltransferase involved in cell wall biosynthesis
MSVLASGHEVSAKIEELDVAVLIPCHNEAVSIGKVVDEFRLVLPNATIYVYDNNSNDNTREVALKAGAIVREEELQGKGNVVRRMFSDIDADYYILIDGDDTYDVSASLDLLQCAIEKNLDMVNGARVSSDKDAYRPGHMFGNKMLTKIVSFVFGDRIKDMLSGFRVFSRRFVKSFPALSSGFEIETELTIHALELKMPIAEINAQYKGREEGSESKLRTYRDGLMILKMIAMLVKEERPLQFFFLLSLVLGSVSIVLAWPVVGEYLETGLVPRFPTAILSSAIMLLAFLSLFTGMVLDTVTHGRREMKRMWYLSLSK